MKQKDFLNYIVTAILAIGFFLLVYFPLEFLVTEMWLVTPKLPSIIGPFFLLILIFLLSLMRWEVLVDRNKMFVLLLLVFVFLSGFTYRHFRQLKINHENLPKIYSIDPPNWGFQANIIEIRGKNFFPSHRKGKVFIGNQELLVRSWGDNLILAEQQIPTHFGISEIYLIRDDGLASNSIPFVIRNPADFLDLSDE